VTNRLAEIPEAEASGVLRERYEEIRNTLRVPMVNLIYRHMATLPEYLEGAWAELRPNLRTVLVWQAAAKIREAASLDTVIPISTAALEAVGMEPLDQANVRLTLEAYNRVNPMGLMVIIGLLTAMEGKPVGGHTQPPELLIEPPEYKEPITEPLIPMADLDQVEPGVMAFLCEMIRPLTQDEGGIVVPSLLRHFVRWPGFLTLLGVALRPALETAAFSERSSALEELAGREVASWPFPVTVGRDVLEAAGYSPERVEGLEATWRLFVPLIARMIVLGMAVERSLQSRDQWRT
jgi:hypothetical protein